LVLIHGMPIYKKNYQNVKQCYFIFNYLSENKLKVFRWKLLHFIIPTKKLLLKWKIMKNSLCNLCNIVEDYSHYFRTCINFKEFWGKIKELLKKVE
jgi:hypothetical protein